ncbi:hypothetical protein HJ01_00018 [Flavobacterium frigoris PS1]|uniref:Uncharacterized protein n=1 Tax=Flavobacterium frigoris (strain PS1) TaxID=1086011 RepID=H7FLH0_FLAFP|nr:hypothetical protein HJ01_00018 [Flavobacterium frigoris PS1]
MVKEIHLVNNKKNSNCTKDYWSAGFLNGKADMLKVTML